MNLLVAESDAAHPEILADDLRRHGFFVDTVHTGSAAIEGCRTADLLLLELGLPDIDGLEICRRIRTDCDVPIIAMNNRSDEPDRVLGLQMGFDDYVTRPFGIQELVARITAVLRRTKQTGVTRRRITHGSMVIDLRTREVEVRGRSVHLTRKEFDLLALLASDSETVFTRKQIMSRVWNDESSLSSRTIDTHVGSLRSKLGSTTWITTLRGVGFRIGQPQ
ncbi:DNA-binding response OmpR family regulator [Actinopolyspora biskrensis]|uniref:DNA-binding response OmpR family regulator n=1 Tax=Actinopolyspora biskrensis TaxID=1470178 RepID=A0A852Z452_9ACTN|nr:response regulator transcription factor [Actinopolyspora biskrensis]NYH80940.1 DNA-binding response OmpR family regulator [Actinopolyspora biskrensis]